MWIPACLLLLIASFLKTHQLAMFPADVPLAVGSNSFPLPLVVGEILLAFWLMSNWKAELARCVAILAFSIFFSTAIYLIFVGERSCGCFGVFKIPPALTLVVDGTVIISLLLYRPEPSLHQKTHFLLAAILVSGMAVQFAYGRESELLEEIGQTIENNSIVVINPAKWHGKELPIYPLLEPLPARALQGEWRVVLFHEDCLDCQDIISTAQSTGLKFLFVEVPPIKGVVRRASPNLEWSALSTNYDWFVETPTVINILDGRVTSIAR